MLILKYIKVLFDSEMTLSMRCMFVVGLIVCIYIAAILQLIIHEAGHLAFGLSSGYSFSSFRIADFMWQKEGDKIRLRRLSIAGTGGQCLMSPPDFKEGKIPVVLYNLGGAIFNLLFAVLFLWFSILLSKIVLVSALFLFLFVVGLIFSIMNGIPMRVGMVDNDGYNARLLAKDKKAMRAFWLQLKVNEQTAGGLRLKELPNKWFFMPPDSDMNNAMMVGLGVLYCNRLMDLHKLTEAEEHILHMLNMDCGMNELYKRLLLCDRMFLAMMRGETKEEVKALMTKEQVKFMRIMKNYPSVLRTEYGYALLIEENEKKAQLILQRFEKCAKHYPYQSEIYAEREHLEELKGKRYCASC